TVTDPETIERLLAQADGDTALFTAIDGLAEGLRADLQAFLDGELSSRVRFVFSSRYAPELLIGLKGFSPRLVSQLSRRAVRIPRLCERAEDLVETAVALIEAI